MLKKISKKDKKILLEIKKYIIFELSHLMNNTIFMLNDMKELGKFYYKCVLQNIKGADEEKVDYVIEKLYKHLKEKGNDKFEVLLKACNIKYLPKDKYIFVKKEFNKTFMKLFCKLKVSYKRQLNKLELNIRNIDQNLKSNKEKAQSAYKKIEEDLSGYIELEQELLIEKRIVKTQKDIVEFLYKDIVLKIKDYCEQNNILINNKEKILCKNLNKSFSIDREQIKEMLKRKALELSKEYVFEEKSERNPFEYYKIIIERAIGIIDNPKRLELMTIGYVHELNAYKRGYYLFAQESDLNEAEKQYKKDMELIPDFTQMMNMKKDNPEDYLQLLKNIINKDKIIDKIEEYINGNDLIKIRKPTIAELLELYKENKFNSFIAGVPSQIEGIFYDWLRDITRYDCFKKLKTFDDELLRGKIDEILKTNNHVETPIMLYYYTYFNNLVRNRSAHGKLEYVLKNNVEIIANEILFDLYTILFLLTEWHSNEIKYMKKLIDEIDKEIDTNQKEKILKYNILGTRTFMGYPDIDEIPSMQFAYWLINPYYNKIYINIGYGIKLDNVKNLFFQKKIWNNILKEIDKSISEKWDVANISKDFINMICKIMNLQQFDDSTKTILKDIIKKGNKLLNML